MTNSDSKLPESYAAVLTPAGRAAIATIVVVGPEVESRLARCFHSAIGTPLPNIPINRIAFGTWSCDGESFGEELVCCRTSPNEVEIHCHGGRAAIAKILDDLQQAGFPTVHSEQHLSRSEQGTRAELILALSKTSTDLAAAHISAQLQGSLERALHDLVQTVEKNPQDGVLATEVLLKRFQFAQRILQPTHIVISGLPNVGKSSLINQIAGYERAIVYDQPGTTRDVVKITTAIAGIPVEISDTAGIRTTSDDLESEGIERAQQQIRMADIVLFVFDVTQKFDNQWFDEQTKLMGSGQKQIIVLNKCDLPREAETPPESILVSAKTGEGMDLLFEAITRLLNPAAVEVGQPMPVSKRQCGLLQKVLERLKSGNPEEAISLVREILSGPVGDSFN